jgi:hypothetical protein
VSVPATATATTAVPGAADPYEIQRRLDFGGQRLDFETPAHAEAHSIAARLQATTVPAHVHPAQAYLAQAYPAQAHAQTAHQHPYADTHAQQQQLLTVQRPAVRPAQQPTPSSIHSRAPHMFLHYAQQPLSYAAPPALWTRGHVPVAPQAHALMYAHAVHAHAQYAAAATPGGAQTPYHMPTQCAPGYGGRAHASGNEGFPVYVPPVSAPLIGLHSTAHAAAAYSAYGDVAPAAQYRQPSGWTTNVVAVARSTAATPARRFA